jgi:hypothetical protein
MAEVAEFVAESADSFVDAFDAIPVDSFTDISPDSFSYGSEFLSSSSFDSFDSFGSLGDSFGSWDQVGSFAGDANFFDATNFGDITNLSSTLTDFDPTLGGAFTDVNGLLVSTADLQAESFSNIFSGAQEALGIPTELGGNFGGDLLSRAGLVADDFTRSIGQQFSPANINRVVTDFAVQQGRQIVGQAISQVVPPALQPYANQAVNAGIRSATAAPVAGTAGTPGFVGPPAPSTINTGATPTDAGPSFQQFDDGSSFQTFEDGSTLAIGADGTPTSTPAPIFDPYYGLSNSQLEALGDADPTDPYIRARLGIPQLPDSPLNTSDAGLTSLPGAVGNVFSSATTAGSNLIKSLFPGAATAPGTSNDPAAIAAAAAASVVRSLTPGTVNDPGLATPPLDSAALAILATLAPGESALINGQFISAGSPQALALADAAARAQGLLRQAQNQQTARIQANNNAATGDWRVRLQLADSADYLYNAADCGPLLWPLRDTNGVIFPYTPNIDTAYKANYSTYDLTHSNYRGYFYQNSYIDGINIKATFTAQDSAEANYLLAVIHFFRSVTKMFYGQDAQRGTPPPLVFLSGLGDFQFNKHPCLVSQFNYNLPADVNYIRAQSTLSNGGNQLAARTRQTTLGNPIASTINRLLSLGQPIRPGAVTAPFAPQGSLAAGNPTYVPTKMEISLVLLPVQTRSQVSQQFSVKGFANGNLLKGGFW